MPRSRNKSEQQHLQPSDDLRHVVGYILAGHGAPAIHALLTRDGCKDPAGMIADAHRYFAAIAGKTDPASVMGMVLEGFRDLYRQAVAVGDLATARQCLRDMRDTAKDMAEYEFD